MAKRTRYTGRPAGRRPASKTAAPGAARPLDDDALAAGGSALTAAEIARAEALEAEIAQRERAAIAASARQRSRGRAVDAALSGDVNAPLSIRAAHEYAYVARDVRRFLLTGGLMVAILFGLFILVDVLGVITL